MPLRRQLSTTLIITPLLLAAACNSVQPGQAVSAPTPSTTVPTSTSQPNTPQGHSKAPQVKNPLDASKYIADPCASLTSTQLTAFGGAEPGHVNNSDSSPACTWQVGPNKETFLGISYSPAVKNGLNNIYSLNDTGWWKNGYFEPTEIDGYPAAFASISGNRKDGDCSMSIGVRDDLFFSIDVRTRTGSDSCVAAKNVASEVLKTIQRRS
jgi:hypothetical protein